MNLSEQSLIEKNLKSLVLEIEQSILDSDRSPNSVELLPVSKKQSIEKISYLHSLGYQRFGENYAQELFDKAEQLAATDISWVFIGQLQSNKIQKLVHTCDEIQTVASLKHARYINRYSLEANKKNYPIYIAINAAEEPQKAGVKFSEVDSIATEISRSCPNLVTKGVMAIPPAALSKTSSSDKIPELYQQIAQSARKIGTGQLSLGMSHDLAAAIHAGSTCVRVGTRIFGSRTN
jgi:pyridoxal phosphate enzyme (YggS family)